MIHMHIKGIEAAHTVGSPSKINTEKKTDMECHDCHQKGHFV